MLLVWIRVEALGADRLLGEWEGEGPEGGGGGSVPLVPLVSFEDGGGIRSCTWTGSQPPGACVTFWSSRPRRRGIDGPVRSMSRMPTLWPWEVRERASWRVTEDLPTPPLPESTRIMLETFSSGIVVRLVLVVVVSEFAHDAR